MRPRFGFSSAGFGMAVGWTVGWRLWHAPHVEGGVRGGGGGGLRVVRSAGAIAVNVKAR